jgi:hypothetical protein
MRLTTSCRRTVAGFVLGGALSALLLSAGAVSAWSTFCGRWRTGEAPFAVNPNFADPQAGSASAQIAAIRAGADEWSTNGNAIFRFLYQGTTSIAVIDVGDGVNAVYAYAANGGSTLAETYCATNGAGEIIGFDVRFYDSGRTWTSGSPAIGEFDIQGVACHELGHALGLGHSNVADATMYPSTTSGNTSLRTIAADDVAGIQAIYGVRSSVRIDSVNPSSGPIRGGTQVTISGSSLSLGNRVFFDGVEGTVVSSPDPSTLVARTPPGNRFAAVDVEVRGGSGTATRSAGFIYETNPPAVSYEGYSVRGSTIQIVVYGPPNAPFGLACDTDAGPTTRHGLELCFGFSANFRVLNDSVRRRGTGIPLDWRGEARIPFVVPSDPEFVLRSIHFQSVEDVGTEGSRSLALTPCLAITVFP